MGGGGGVSLAASEGDTTTANEAPAAVAAVVAVGALKTMASQRKGIPEADGCRYYGGFVMQRGKKNNRLEKQNTNEPTAAFRGSWLGGVANTAGRDFR